MEQKKIGILVGSARKGSFSRMVAETVAGMLDSSLQPEFIEIDDLAMYNQDFDEDGNVPAEWVAFRQKIGACQGYLFVTPEYNRSVPPVLKNALDIASRPYGQSQWSDKPGAVVGVSPGSIGAFGAVNHLRQSLTFLNVNMMQQPEAYVGGAAGLFDGQGKLTNEGTQKFLRQFADSFCAWVKKLA